MIVYLFAIPKRSSCAYSLRAPGNAKQPAILACLPQPRREAPKYLKLCSLRPLREIFKS